MRSDLEVWRKGQFQFKQIVSDLLTEVISGAIDRAEEYIQKTELVTFNYGELQMLYFFQIFDCVVQEFNSTDDFSVKCTFSIPCREVGLDI